MIKSYQMKIGDIVITKRKILVKIAFLNEAFGYAFYEKISPFQMKLKNIYVSIQKNSFSFRRLNYSDIWYNGYVPLGPLFIPQTLYAGVPYGLFA